MTRMAVEYVKASESALEEAKGKGNQVFEPEADLKASVEEFRKKSLDGIYSLVEEKYQIKDGKALIDDYLQTYKKWEDLLKNVDRNDEEALAKLAMQEIYDTLPADYGVK